MSLTGGDPGDTAVWTSSDPSILKVSNGGVFVRDQTLVPLKPGYVTLTARVPGTPAITKKITVVKIQIDPVVPFLNQGTQGQLVTPDMGGKRLNEIWNPAAVVIPPPGTDPSSKNGGQLLASTAAVVTLTDIEPLNLNLTENDPRIQWKIAPDGANGGSALFYNEHPKGQADASNGTLGYGSEVRLYGVTPGRILLTAYLDPGGGPPLVQLDQYEALVTSEVDVHYRAQLLSRQVTAEGAAKQIRFANSFLWQAGVRLVPDAADVTPDGQKAGAQAAGAGIFTYQNYDQTQLSVDFGVGRAPATHLIGVNALKTVWNIAYVNDIQNSSEGTTEAGVAVAVPPPKVAGKQGFNVSLKYRIDLQDSIGGGPHTMHLLDGHPAGDFGLNYGALISGTTGRDALGVGRTIAHETGHFMHLAHRDLPAFLRQPVERAFLDSSYDGLDRPHDLNLMDEPIDDQGNPLPQDNRDDLDLIQTYVMHGLLP